MDPEIVVEPVKPYMDSRLVEPASKPKMSEDVEDAELTTDHNTPSVKKDVEQNNDPKLYEDVELLKPCMDPSLLKKPRMDPEAPVKTNKKVDQCDKLYKAALEGNWEAAEKIFDSNADAMFDKIATSFETVLHIAAASKQTEFVIKLVNRLSPEDVVDLKNDIGQTALHLSVLAGDIRAAEALVKKNPKLTQIWSVDGDTPISLAACYGYKELLLLLCDVTKMKIRVHSKVLKVSISSSILSVLVSTVRIKEKRKSVRYFGPSPI